jgi:uncharacterized membrane protein
MKDRSELQELDRDILNVMETDSLCQQGWSITRAGIAQSLGYPQTDEAINLSLRRLKSRGLIENRTRGCWRRSKP